MRNNASSKCIAMPLCRCRIGSFRIAAQVLKPLCTGIMEVDFALEDGVAGQEGWRPRDFEVAEIDVRGTLRSGVVGVVVSLESRALDE